MYTMVKYTTEEIPAAELLLIPTKIKPTWAMEEKARNRLMFCCLNANRLPSIIVAIDKLITMMYQICSNGKNTLYKVEIKIKAIADFEITDKKEVTAIGEP